MRVEVIVDPSFEHPSDVDDLAKEVKLVKEWLESLVFTLNTAFLDSEMNPAPAPTVSRRPSKEPEVDEVAEKASKVEGVAVKGSEVERSIVAKVVKGERGIVKEAEVKGSIAREPKDPVIVIEPPVAFSESSRPIPTTQAVRTKRRLMFLSSDDERDDAPTPKKAQMDSTSQPAKSPSPEIVVIELTPAQHRKGRAPLRRIIEQGVDLSKVLRDAYHRDTMFTKIMAHPDAHLRFGIRDRLIWTKKQLRETSLPSPALFFRGEGG
ncbi:hypothetical protein JB92DRAFT_3117707 [Gautieria morchelliformis]|nr:hypothetical protein JB92DRAFT_3117707 [Gautieria morchelliformis]